MSQEYYFPFGQKLTKVHQENRLPKKVFILGVYASAVHAKWKDKNGTQIVSALAVASEPYIFWKGEDAEKIISSIQIPAELGWLEPSHLNGPSGKALDNLYLAPLGLERSDAWLCDLLPEARINPQQRKAIDDHYSPIISEYSLPEVTVPDFKKSELDAPNRCLEILEELESSKAETIIVLGDLPICWFIRLVANKKYSKLSDFNLDGKFYGRPNEIVINDNHYNLIPLCHPRQAGRLGRSSAKWGALHDGWMKSNEIKV
jgi:hypothetical protein